MMREVKLSHKILSSVLALLMVFTSFPIINTYAAIDENLGQVSAITKPAEINDVDQSNIIVTYNDEITLDWSPKNADRAEDGWWVGINMNAPNLGTEVLSNSKYKSKASYNSSLSEEKSFWDFRDSKDKKDDETQYITLWSFVTEKKIADAIENNKSILETQWLFDWNYDTFEPEQTVIVQIDASKVKLMKDNEQVYPIQPGTVTAITNEKNAVIDDKDSANIVVSYKDKLELDWSDIDENTNMPRTKTGWWAGIKMTAPDLNEAVLKNAKYDSLANGTTDWVVGKDFWKNQDSKETDEQHYITLWTFVNEEDLNDALASNSSIANSWRFDWNNDNLPDQTVTTQINPSEIKVILNKDNKQVYPATELGTVTKITGTPNIENDKTNSVIVSYDKEVTLQWSQASNETNLPRPADGWWAGIKMTAPQGADLENAKYKSKATPESKWVEGKEFAKAKDGDDFITLWAYVANEDMLKNGINTQWGFDWDNDGVYEQYVDFKFDSTYVTLDSAHLYAMDENAPVFGDDINNTDEQNVVWVNDPVTISGSVTDFDEKYVSGIKEIYYAKGEHMSETKPENTVNLDLVDGRFSFEVTDDYQGWYTIVCVDNAGNIATQKVYVKIDNTAPEFKNVTPNITEWKKGSITIEGTVIDTLSKVKSVEYSQGKNGDKKSADLNAETGAFSFEIPSNITYSGEYYIYCTDNAGKENIATVLVNIDNEKCIVVLNSNSKDWTNKPITITGSIQDNHSGIGSIFYRKSLENDLKNFENIVESKEDIEEKPDADGSFVINLPADDYAGNYTVYGKDKVGNISNGVTFEVNMDKTAPVVNSVETPADWTNQNVTVKGTVSDNLSNVKAVFYKLVDDENWSEATLDKDGKDYSFEIEKQNYNDVVQVYCVDNADNESEVISKQLFMDIEEPSDVEITYSDKHNVIETITGAIFWFFNPNKEMPCDVTLTSTDNLSGIRCFEYSLDDGETFTTVDKDTANFVPSEKSATYTFTIAPQFKGKVTAKAIDNSGTGNTSVLKIDEKTIVVDTKDPVITSIKYNEVNKADNKYYYSSAAAENAVIEFSVDEENFFETYSSASKLVNAVTVNVTKDNYKDGETKYTNFVKEFDETNKKIIITIPLEGNDGDYSIELSYSDSSRNTVSIKTETIVIDTIAPEITAKYKTPINTANGIDYYNEANPVGLEITVREHNFDPAKFTSKITAKNIAGDNFEDVEKSLVDFCSNKENWKSVEGKADTYIISVPLENANANYVVDYEFQDLALNAAVEAAAKAITYDTLNPEIEISTSVALAYKVLNAITFGFFNPDATFTVTVKDVTAGIKNGKIESKVVKVENARGEFLKEFDIADAESVELKDGIQTAIFEYKLPSTDYKNGVKAVVYDYSENNESTENIADENGTYNGIVVDTTDPVFTSIVYNEKNSNVNDGLTKYYYSADAKIVFTVDEEYFFENYYETASEAKAGSDNSVSALKNDVTLEITKNGDEYYKGSAVAREENSKLFKSEFDKNAKTITVTIPSVLDGNANDGDFSVTVGYTDLADHYIEVTTDIIVIDTTAPVVEITYDDEKKDNRVGKGYFLNRTATITVVEHNFTSEYIDAILFDKSIMGDISTIAGNEVENIKTTGWTHKGDIHTFTIHCSDDAIYDFSLNKLQDMALNDMKNKKGNETVFKNNTETPEHFVVDKTVPTNVEITYSDDLYKNKNENILENILDNLFWFYNPKNDAPCQVTLTTTDMTSGLQYFTYSYDGNDTVVTENTNGGEKQAKGWKQDEKDLSKFTYTFTIDPQFRGKVTATATDNAGNVTANKSISDKTIIVDNIAPKIKATYPEPTNVHNNISYYDKNITINLNVKDENFMDGEFADSVRDILISTDIVDENNNKTTKSYKVNNWERVNNTDEWTGSFVLSTEGDYTLNISYTDKSGNIGTYSKSNFTIDKTAPTVDVKFDSIKSIHKIDGREYYNTNRSAVITVTEHNFFPEYFETENILKAQNILGDEVTNYIKYFKDSKNWTTDSTGNVHTIKVDFKSDANYTFDFEFEDLAKNKCADYQEYLFTVDKTAPKNLKVSYSANVYETVINAITFGYYDSKMTVTISADDDTTGIYHFMYSYLTAKGVSDVNAQLVNDAINRAKITRNGKTSTATFTIPKSSLERNSQFNGTVEFIAYDYAENNTYRDDTKRVIVDNISPTSTITFNEPVQNANNVSYYAGNIDATISINEANFYSQDVEVIVTKDGSRYPVSVNWTDNSVDSHTGTFRLTEDGDYVVRIVYSDRSGNAMATYESNQLTIDTVDPVIAVTGLNHQSANNGETIGFSISVTDKNIALSEFKPVLTAVIRNDKGELETITISLGDPATSTNEKGETVYTYTVQNLSVDGFYSLTCSAVDYANHSVNLINSGQDNGTSSNEETMNFSVNRNGSTFWIETTHNDKYSSKTFTNELDKAYANDSVEIVVHELNVDQVNISNNRDEETVFALHDGSSTGYVTLQEGNGSNGNYVKNTLRGEGGWYETRYTLSNDNFAHDGVYSFSILSYDRAGNSNLNTKDDAGVIKFTVDRTNPVITSNISANQVIDADNYTVEFEVNDTNHDKNTVEVMLNGKPVPSESITNLGGNSYSFEMSTGSKQSVSVTSKDLAGNTADQYEINDVTVSTNRFILFYYSHTLLFWIIVAGIVLLALLILFIVFRRKKDEDEDEEKA